MPQTYDISIVFWGEKFRDLFLRYCAASLIAPDNVPALSNHCRVRILIATTPQDWEALKDHPTIRALSQYSDVLPRFLPDDGPRDKYARMSQGHRLVLQESHAVGAYASVLCPDSVLSDGALRELRASLDAGHKMTLAPAVRFSESGSAERLSDKARPVKDMGDATVLRVTPRELVRSVIGSLHHETKAHIWGNPNFSSFPVHLIFPIPQSEGLLLHTYSWAPLAIDFAKLPTHDVRTLETWTLDGDYIYRNCPNEADLDVIEDSDRLFYASLTDDEDRPMVTTKNLMPRLSLKTSYFSDLMDPLKRKLFKRSIRIHAEELDATELSHGARVFESLSSVLERPPSNFESAALRYFGFGYHSVRRHFFDWMGARFGIRNG